MLILKVIFNLDYLLHNKKTTANEFIKYKNKEIKIRKYTHYIIIEHTSSKFSDVPCCFGHGL